MSVSTTSTWDENPPKRPGLSDITDGTKENRPGREPSPAMPNAHEDNQRAKQIAGAGGILPMAILHVTFPGGVPTIAAVKAMGTNVTAANFTAVDNDAGDTTIHWASSVLPPVWSAPGAVTHVDDAEIDRTRAFYTSVGANQAVRVKTKLAGVGTDAAFTIEIL